MGLLEPGFLKKLASLTLRSRRRAVGVNLGERRSIRRGQSQEFADHRPYVAGDDLRFLDWHLYARLDTLWVKLFEEEQDRTVQCIIDSSASMEGEKLEYARKLAGALSFVALGRADRVTVAAVGDRMHSFAPARRGRGAAMPVFRTLEAIRPGGGTDLSTALEAYPRVRGAGIGLLFSDMLYEEGAEVPLRRLLARGMELHVFHVLHPLELEPQLEGDVLLVDSETGEQVAVTMTEDALARYRDRVAEWLEETRQTCRRLGVGYTQVITSLPVEDFVLRDLRRQGVLA